MVMNESCILNALPDAVCVVTSSGQVTHSNTKFRRFIRHTDDVIGDGGIALNMRSIWNSQHHARFKTGVQGIISDPAIASVVLGRLITSTTTIDQESEHVFPNIFGSVSCVEQ